MKTRTSTWHSLAAGMVCFLPSILLATVIGFDDDFAGPVLDAAWTQTLGGSVAMGADSHFAGSRWIVTDLQDGTVNTGWASLELSRVVHQPGDFSLVFDFDWDSGGSVLAMQGLAVLLTDADGAVLARGGYHDPWIGERGQMSFDVGAASYRGGENQLPYAGGAVVAMQRTGSVLRVFWDGNLVLADDVGGTLAGITLRMTHYAFSEGSTMSLFGSFGVDRLTLRPVPEPGSLGLLGVALAGLVARRKRG